MGYGVSGIAETATRMVIKGLEAGYKYYEDKQVQKDFEAAAKDTEVLNELNQRAEQARAGEEERRALAQAERDTSLARARAGATGAAINRGSMADYLTLLESENMQEYDWVRKANATKLDAMQQQGANQVKTLKSQGKAASRSATGQLISGAANIYEFGMDAGGWFDTSNSWYTK